MPKSKIIKDIVEDVIPMEISLSRLKVLAVDIKNKKLEKWATNELLGYKEIGEIPSYRKTRSSSFRYSGINGNFQTTNVPLQEDWLDEKILDKIKEVNIMDGIRYIQELANGEAIPTRDVSFLASYIYDETDGMVSCTSISQIISRTVYLSILEEVKDKMITVLCELEEKYGNLDDLVIDITNMQRKQIDASNDEINKSINIIIPGDNSKKKDSWYSKLGWNVIVPIITGVIGAVAGAVILSGLGI